MRRGEGSRLYERFLYAFPFLAEDRISHPYQMFYLIWKISYLWGANFSHYSIAYEALISNSESVLKDLCGIFKIDNFSIKNPIYYIST